MGGYAVHELPLFAARARRNDVEPSQIAAAAMNQRLTKTHAQLVFRMMQMMAVPMTAVELATLINGIDRIEITRRLSGLEKAGMIEKCGQKQHCGLKYSMWRIKAL